MKRKIFVRLLGFLILLIGIIICAPVEACPGGESVYAYTEGSFWLAFIMVVLCTSAIILFALNLKEYLTKKGSSKKIILFTFIWVLGTAVLNVLTFAFFIKKEEIYMSGTTSNMNTTSIIAPFIVIGIIFFFVGIVYWRLR